MNGYVYADSFDQNKLPDVHKISNELEQIYSKYSHEKLVPYHTTPLRFTFEMIF